MPPKHGFDKKPAGPQTGPDPGTTDVVTASRSITGQGSLYGLGHFGSSRVTVVGTGSVKSRP